MANTVPNDSGWQGSYIAIRVYVEHTYNAQQNKSSVTVKLQGHYPGSGAYNDTFSLSGRNNADRTFKINGVTVITFPGTVSTPYTVKSNTGWNDLLNSGSTWSYTNTYEHNASGVLTLTFAFDAFAQSQSGVASYNNDFSGSTATLTITETPQSGGTVWVYDGGWKECVPYVYDGGWQKCEAYIYDNGWVKA